MTEEARVTWAKRVARWRASGETAATFGAREGIKASTLRWWSSKLKARSAAAPTVRMVQLVRVPPSIPHGTGVIIDVIDARARVVVEPGFDRDTLAHVLETLGVRSAR